MEQDISHQGSVALARNRKDLSELDMSAVAPDGDQIDADMKSAKANLTK